MVTTAQDSASDQADYHDARQNSHHANIQTHITVQDMTEFMRYDTLQFIPVEGFEGAACDCNSCIARAEACGKGVNAAF